MRKASFEISSYICFICAYFCEMTHLICWLWKVKCDIQRVRFLLQFVDIAMYLKWCNNITMHYPCSHYIHYKCNHYKYAYFPVKKYLQFDMLMWLKNKNKIKSKYWRNSHTFVINVLQTDVKIFVYTPPEKCNNHKSSLTGVKFKTDLTSSF